MKSLRDWVADRLDGCTPPELAGAVQSLRYQGKLAWDRLELSDSMRSAGFSLFPAEEGGAARAGTAPPSGPDDPDDYPGEVNDQTTGGDTATPLAGPAAGRREPTQPVSASEAGGHRGHNAHAHAGGFVPRKLLHQAGVHAAATRAASRPLPAPDHEPEVARQVREECNELAGRRSRARSTATVRQPLELRKYGVPDMDLSEAIGTMLTDSPQAVMRAVSRKHPGLWRRSILLSRTRGESPMQALYAALERGLAELEGAAGLDQAAA
jgi:hypothetical protein